MVFFLVQKISIATVVGKDCADSLGHIVWFGVEVWLSCFGGH